MTLTFTRIILVERLMFAKKRCKIEVLLKYYLKKKLDCDSFREVFKCMKHSSLNRFVDKKAVQIFNESHLQKILWWD